MSLFGALTSAVSSIQRNVSNTFGHAHSTATNAVTSISQRLTSTSRNIQSTATNAVTTVGQTVNKTAEGAKSLTPAFKESAKVAAMVALPPVGIAVATSKIANSEPVKNITSFTGNTVSSAQKVPQAAVSTAVTTADTVIDKRDAMYASDDAAERAAALGADVLLPLDLMNVVNKTATGRGGELATEDYIGAAIDAVGIGLGAVTGGVGYVAIKAGKTGVKGAGKMVVKFNKAAKVTAPKKAPVKKVIVKKKTPSINSKPVKAVSNKQNTVRKQSTPVRQTTTNKPVNVAKATAKPAKTNTPVTAKAPKTPKAKTNTTTARPKSSLVDLAGLASSVVMTALFGWMAFGDQGYEYDDPGVEYVEEGYYAEDPLLETPDGMYYESPLLPDELQGLEEFAEGVGGYLEDVPLLGDIAETARRNGLSLPFLAALGIGGFFGGRWLWRKYKASTKKTPAKRSTTKKTSSRKPSTAKRATS